MTGAMRCPDCMTPLGGADRCRCGWIVPRGAVPSSSVAARFCATVGCEQRALGYSKLCSSCDERARRQRSEAFCKSRGLVTVEDKREFCKKLARSFGRGPTFETWAKNITQATVDRIVVLSGGAEDKCLERLRAVGAIDGRNKLIPVGEAREIAAEAYHRERARMAAAFARELAERGEVKAEGTA